MPHIGSVMERSLVPERSTGEALLNLLARSVAAGFMKRDAISDAKGQVMDVKTTFSSWDNCMKASYCKWPLIAIIIIVGLIVFSIIWCCIRCLCCGLSCCCSCFRCLKCCGNCCGCCDSPQQKNKYLDEPFVPPHHAENQAYRSQAPMFAPTMAPTMMPATAPSYAKSEPPQYAEFETGKKGGGDELPEMPSWDGASSKKVLIEEDAVELEPMKKPDPMQNASNASLMGGMSRGVSPAGVSPANGNSPYGTPSQAGPNGYMGAARSENNMYGMNGNGSGHVYNDGYNNGSYGQASRENMNQGYGNQPYGDQSGGQGYDQGYGMPAAGTMAAAGVYNNNNNNGGYGREQMNQGMNQGYPQSRTPKPYDDYSRSITPSNAAYGNAPPARGPTPQGNGPYGGSPNRMRTPAPQQQGGDGYNNPRGYNQGGYGGPDPRMRASPAPQLQQQQSGYSQNDGYGGGYGARSQTPNVYGRQPQPGPGPRRQNTYDVTPQTARAPPQRSYTDVPPPVSPIQNTGGFDFTSGYSRDNAASPPPLQAPQAANGGTAYPGYRAYKPAV